MWTLTIHLLSGASVSALMDTLTDMHDRFMELKNKYAISVGQIKEIKINPVFW